MKKVSYIQALINEGEHQQLDFKFGITDSRTVWQKMKQKKGALIRYTKIEEELFRLFQTKDQITLSDFRKGARISSKQAIETLSNLIVLRLIHQVVASPESFFRLNPE